MIRGAEHSIYMYKGRVGKKNEGDRLLLQHLIHYMITTEDPIYFEKNRLDHL